jgi:pilus assembly protein CpaE
VISVLGAKAGVGATTLAVNLAAACAAQGRTVLLDLEPDGAAALHLGLKPEHGLIDLLAYPPDTLDMDSIENALTLHSGGLNVLAASSAALDTARASVILTELRDVYDVCLLDLGAGASLLAQAMVSRSNLLLLALDGDRVTLAQAEHVMRGLAESGLPLPEIKLVRINRLGTPDEVALPAIKAALAKEAVTLGPASEVMYQSLERGEPLVLSQPDHPVAAQIRTLAATLVNTG